MKEENVDKCGMCGSKAHKSHEHKKHHAKKHEAKSKALHKARGHEVPPHKAHEKFPASKEIEDR